jgi:hypothetical protein
MTENHDMLGCVLPKSIGDELSRSNQPRTSYGQSRSTGEFHEFAKLSHKLLGYGLGAGPAKKNPSCRGNCANH